jgi:DNA polymerase
MSPNKLESIYTEAKTCSRCSTIPTPECYAKHCVKHPVPGYSQRFGGVGAKIVFVMESPGIAAGGAGQTGNQGETGNFDATARNGDKLRQIAGIQDKDCFFTNSILHAGMTEEGKMRKPTRDEMKNCSYFLKQIIEAINPPIVVPMGSIALKAINFIENHPYSKITECAGNPFDWFGRIALPLCHCSPLGLANRNWDLQVEDYKKLKSLLLENY